MLFPWGRYSGKFPRLFVGKQELITSICSREQGLWWARGAQPTSSSMRPNEHFWAQTPAWGWVGEASSQPAQKHWLVWKMELNGMVHLNQVPKPCLLFPTVPLRGQRKAILCCRLCGSVSTCHCDCSGLSNYQLHTVSPTLCWALQLRLWGLVFHYSCAFWRRMSRQGKVRPYLVEPRKWLFLRSTGDSSKMFRSTREVQAHEISPLMS